MPSAFPTRDMLKEFGVSAMYKSPEGEMKEITVIFDRVYAFGNVGGSTVSGMTASAICDDADIADADNRAILTINDVLYKVLSAQPDGAGLTLLTLSED